MKAPLFSKDVVFKNNTYQDPQLDKFYSILRQYWAEAEGFEPEPSEARNPDDDDDGIDDGYESPPHSDSESEEEAEAAEPQVENTQEPVTQPMPEVSEGGKGENPALAAMGPTGEAKGDSDEVAKTSPTETIQEPVVPVAPPIDSMPPPPVPKKRLLDTIPKGSVTSQDRENVKKRMEELKLLGGKESKRCFSLVLVGFYDG